MDIQDTDFGAAVAAFIASPPQGLEGFLGLNGDPAATLRALEAYLTATGFSFPPRSDTSPRIAWPAGIDFGGEG